MDPIGKNFQTRHDQTWPLPFCTLQGLVLHPEPTKSGFRRWIIGFATTSDVFKTRRLRGGVPKGIRPKIWASGKLSCFFPFFVFLEVRLVIQGDIVLHGNEVIVKYYTVTIKHIIPDTQCMAYLPTYLAIAYGKCK